MFLTKNISKILVFISVISNGIAILTGAFIEGTDPKAIILKLFPIVLGFLSLLFALLAEIDAFRTKCLAEIDSFKTEYSKDKERDIPNLILKDRLFFEKLNKISDNIELFKNECLRGISIESRALKNDIFFKRINQISDNYFSINFKHNSPEKEILRQQAENKLEEFVDDLNEVSKGKIKLNGTQRIDLVINLIQQQAQQTREHPQQTKASVYAISYGDISSWWNSSVGVRFFEENKTISRLGIPIKRIFILSERGEALKNMRDIIIRQEQSNIEVYIAIEETIGAHVMNLLVCDNFFTSWTTISSDGYDTEGYVSLNKKDIRDKKGIFQKVEEKKIEERRFRNLLLP